MAESANQTVIATVNPTPKKAEETKGVAEAEAECEEGSDVEESDEEIVLDEASDTENYQSPEGAGEDGSDNDDDSCSSGEEEDISVVMTEVGGQKFYKLGFKDLEAKKKEIEQTMKEGEEVAEKEVLEQSQEGDKLSASSASFKDYRLTSIIDEDLEKYYNEEEDEPYNPVMSDVSDIECSGSDTEDEFETEVMDGTHKKTGESLICLKMAEQLKLPPLDESCSTEMETAKPSDQTMEYS